MLLDKPAGISSFACLTAVKRTLGTRKVGHVGTLDPFATGLVGALTHRYTRLAQLLSGLSKTYVTTMRFGVETTTLDPEGEPASSAAVPEWPAVEAALGGFVGTLRQRPPAFSAVHVSGRRAYDLARRGEQPTLPERSVVIHALRTVDWQPPDLTLEIECSSGTYIRSLARDVGLAAGSRASLTALRRTHIGPFTVEEAVPPDDFAAAAVLAPAAFLPRVPGVGCSAVRGTARARVQHGQRLKAAQFASGLAADCRYCALFDADDEQRLLAVFARADDGDGDGGDGSADAAAEGQWRILGVFAA